MNKRFKFNDVALILIGLVGVVLLWINLDAQGIILYISFLFFGITRSVSYFKLDYYERNMKEILKLISCMLISVISVSHLLVGDEPLIILISVMLLLSSLFYLEPIGQDVSESGIQ